MLVCAELTDISSFSLLAARKSSLPIRLEQVGWLLNLGQPNTATQYAACVARAYITATDQALHQQICSWHQLNNWSSISLQLMQERQLVLHCFMQTTLLSRCSSGLVGKHADVSNSNRVCSPALLCGSASAHSTSPSHGFPTNVSMSRKLDANNNPRSPKVYSAWTICTKAKLK